MSGSRFFENENLAFDENGDPNPWYYEMHCLGFNYRITDLQCALGINQLEKFSIFKQKRRTLVDRYNQNLLAYDGCKAYHSRQYVPVTFMSLKLILKKLEKVALL